MSIEECEILVRGLEEELALIDINDLNEQQRIKKQINDLREQAYKNLSPWDRVCIARGPKRPKAMDYINNLFTNFIELHGDYYFQDDKSIIGGLGYFEGIPVTILAQAKGKTLEENVMRNFGSTNPDGFRKTKRLALQAEKFNRPIITIVDTSGAYPGKGAEERGQSRAIAENLECFSDLKVPCIAIVIGEGGSGGALALSVCNRILMLENSVYSILSPEGFSAILFKDGSKTREAAELMELTAYDLKEKGIVDYIVKEPYGGAQNDFNSVIEDIKKYIQSSLKALCKMSKEEIVEDRFNKFRNIGKM